MKCKNKKAVKRTYGRSRGRDGMFGFRTHSKKHPYPSDSDGYDLLLGICQKGHLRTPKGSPTEKQRGCKCIGDVRTGHAAVREGTAPTGSVVTTAETALVKV